MTQGSIIPGIYLVVHNPLTPFPGESNGLIWPLLASSGLFRHQALIWCTDTNVNKTHTLNESRGNERVQVRKDLLAEKLQRIE